MDMQARRDMYTMAEWAATLDALDRLHERRNRRRRWLHFLINAHQVVHEPTVAVPASDVQTGSPSASGVGSGAAGSSVNPPAPTTSAVGSHLPGRPHHPLEAVRISGGITWN